MGTPLKATEPASKIATGHYTGKITAVEFRTEPFSYVDFVFEVELPGQESRKIKVGFSSNPFTPATQLGSFIKQITDFKVGDEVDIERIAIGQRFEFDIVNAPGKKDKSKTYSNIVAATLKIVK